MLCNHIQESRHVRKVLIELRNNINMNENIYISLVSPSQLICACLECVPKLRWSVNSNIECARHYRRMLATFPSQCYECIKFHKMTWTVKVYWIKEHKVQSMIAISGDHQKHEMVAKKTALRFVKVSTNVL